jgi:8-oxo-dGTP diphosphatase
MSERKKVTAAVIFKNGKVLVAQRSPESSLPNKWEFPGGKMEENETPEDCLKREIQEELNIDIKVKEYLCSSFLITTIFL